MNSRRMVAVAAVTVLIVAAVVAGLRLNQPVELIPAGVEVVIAAEGAVFYLGDEFRGEDQLVLTPAESVEWTDADLGFTHQSSPWNPDEVLRRLYPGSEIKVEASRSDGLATASMVDGLHVPAQIQAVGSFFVRDGVADHFSIISLQLPRGGTHDYRHVGRWMVRVVAPGKPRAHFANPRVELELHSSWAEEWFLRRMRYSVRCVIDAELHPAKASVGALWAERAEERRAKSGSPDSER